MASGGGVPLLIVACDSVLVGRGKNAGMTTRVLEREWMVREDGGETARGKERKDVGVVY